MRRAHLSEPELDRLLDRARDAGVALRVSVDPDGEASFTAGGLGTFSDLVSLERALADAARVAA